MWKKFLIDLLLKFLDDFINKLPAEASEPGADASKNAKLTESLKEAKAALTKGLACCE